jgi:hypothetical protein
MLNKARLLTRPTLADTSPARPESAKTASSPKDALYPERGPSHSLYLPIGEGPRLPSTARIERAQFHRARSASKEGTCRSLPILRRPRVARAKKIIRLHPLRCSGSKGSARVSFHLVHRARSASKGIVPATPPLFSILLDRERLVLLKDL